MRGFPCLRELARAEAGPDQGQIALELLQQHLQQIGPELALAPQVGNRPLARQHFRRGLRVVRAGARRNHTIGRFEAGQQRQQIGGTHRLGQVIGHAMGQAFVADAVHGVGGEADHRHLETGGADPFGRLEAVHARHLQVHQHDVEGRRQRLGHRCLAVAGHRHAMAGGFQRVAQVDLVDLGVLGQQHRESAAGGLAVDGTQLRHGFLAGNAERHAEAEGAAMPLLAVDPDRAVHQFAQARADRQPEAGAAELAPDLDVALGECFEDRSLSFGRDADAGIADRDLEVDAAVAFAGHPDTDRDTAFAGELEGVAHQVDQDLPDPRRVAQQPPRQPGTALQRQRQCALPGLPAQRLQGLVE